MGDRAVRHRRLASLLSDAMQIGHDQSSFAGLKGDMWGVDGHDSEFPHPHPGEQFICLSVTGRTEILEAGQRPGLAGNKANTSIALK